MITPRETFRRGPHAKVWTDTTATSGFHAAAEAALAQMALEGANENDVAISAARHWQIVGARRFLDTLMNLTIEPEKAKPPAGAQLKYK